MKTQLGILLLLTVALLGGLPLMGQPAQKLVQVVVTPDRPDWKYRVGDRVTFTVQVLQAAHPIKGVVVDYELGPEQFPQRKQQDTVLKEGTTLFRATMKEPGFLRCRVVAKTETGTYEGMATVAVSEDQIHPLTPEPADFDAFWSGAIAQAREVPLNPLLTLLPDRCTSTQNVYEVSFQVNRPGARMYGILIMPKAAGRYPAVLKVPGAGIRAFKGYNLGEDIITLEVGIHGIPVTLPDVVYGNLGAGALNGYNRINTTDRDQFYYKRVYLGCLRAVDFLCALPEYDGQRLGVTGGSQGGLLSLVTAALDPRVRFMALNHPAMCDFGGYLHHRAGGWPHYFRSTQPKVNEAETLAYFDGVNFARRVTIPGWYAWGYNDVICPPTSLHATYNVIKAPKELHLYLDAGHWTYPEWMSASDDWMKAHCLSR